jgi:hypothetical protein
MHLFAPHRSRRIQSPASPVSVELLENRRLLSVTTLVTTDSPVAALDLNATAGKKFHDVVGDWTNATGLPAKGSGAVAVAIINWGDGKTTRGKFVDDGSGVIQITGSHAWHKPGTFQTVVTVDEYPKGHSHQLTEIGTGSGSAVVTPKPHKVSVKGTLTGTYTTPLGNPDARSYVFTGTGTAGAMGAVSLDGTITPPGFILSAPANGEFTLTNADGTITLDLTGKPQPGGSPLPEKMTYTVSGGTGAFANAGGKGTVSIAVDDTANTFIIVIH